VCGPAIPTQTRACSRTRLPVAPGLAPCWSTGFSAAESRQRASHVQARRPHHNIGIIPVMGNGFRYTARVFLVVIGLCAAMFACGKGAPSAKEEQRQEKSTGGAKPGAAPSGPEVQWELRIGRKLPEKMYCDGREVYVADSIGDILALSVEDGAQRIAVHVPGPIMGWDIQGDLIASSSIDKNVHLNDTTTGEERWSIPCETTPSEPAFAGKGVVFGEGMGPYRVKYISVEDGKTLWSRVFKAKPSGYAPAANSDTAFIAFDDRYIRALSLEDGHTLWEYQVGNPLEIKAGGRWTGEYGFLGESGELNMRLQPIQAGGIGRIIVDPNSGVLVPSEDGYVRCFRPVDGKPVWERKFDDRVWRMWEPSFPENIGFYAETVEGRFVRMNPKTGEIIASQNLLTPTLGCIFLNTTLIADTTGDNGEAVLRVLTDLKERRRMDLDLTPIGGMQANDKLIVRSDDGRIVCIQKPEE